MPKPIFPQSLSISRPVRIVVFLAVALLVFVFGSSRAAAETLEGGDESLTPVDSSSSLTPVAEGDNPLTPLPETADPASEAESAPVYAAIGLESSIRVGIGADGAGCAAPTGPPAAPPHADQPVTFCYIVENLGSTRLAEIVISDTQLGLNSAALTSVGSDDILEPGQKMVFFHHATAGLRTAAQPSVVSAKSIGADGAGIAGLAAATAQSSPGAVLPAPTGLASTTEETDTSTKAATVEQPAPVSVPTKADAAVAAPADPTEDAAKKPIPAATDAAAKAEAQGATATELAFTGMSTEPWVLAIFGSAFIFFGYTVITAVRRPRHLGQPNGHEQLDELGFD